jgi:hypothetical protein
MAGVKASKAIGGDRPQWCTIRSQEASANSGKVIQFPTSITTRDRVGIEVITLEQDFTFVVDPLAVYNSGFAWGLTQLYNAGTAPTGIYDPGVVILQRIMNRKFGTAATELNVDQMFTLRLSEPMLTHPASLYAFIIGYGQTNPLPINMRVLFRYVDLDEKTYQDLLQTIIAQNVL